MFPLKRKSAQLSFIEASHDGGSGCIRLETLRYYAVSFIDIVYLYGCSESPNNVLNPVGSVQGWLYSAGTVI